MEAPHDDPSDCVLFPPGSEPWSGARINRVIEDFGPDVVVTSGPLFALGVMRQTALREFVVWVGYAFFEGSPLPTPLRAVLREMDRVAVASSWCYAVLASGPRHEARLGSPVRVIPLGVDTQTFYPRPDRNALRAAAGLADKFVIGCVARNDFRKQIPLLIKAFAAFAERHADAFLYLHMDPDGPVWRLLDLIKRCRLEQRVAFTRGLAGPLGVGVHSLNAVYNLFDVMALPTMGEAFCLPVLEAMAAGVPVIATDCTAVTELLEGRGELVAVRDWLTLNWDNAEYALADVDDLLDKLERLYADAALRMEYMRKGRAFAQTMTWDRTADAWMRLLDGAVSHRAKQSRRTLAPWLDAIRRGASHGMLSHGGPGVMPRDSATPAERLEAVAPGSREKSRQGRSTTRRRGGGNA
jgi:glycosyltransferase involved in cell wall biosynthesis